MTKEEWSKLIMESAEKKEVSDIPSYKKGFVDGVEFSLDKIESIVDKEPERKSVTLQELADWLSQVIAFEHLTVHYEDGAFVVCLWLGSGAPAFADGVWWHCDRTECVMEISDYYLLPNLDLSEYSDEYGKIDYGKCIIKCR